MPCLADMLSTGGHYHLARGYMSSPTNPNNMSIVTGVAPDVHGVPGNHFLHPDPKKDVRLTDPPFLRATTIQAAMQNAGVNVSWRPSASRFRAHERIRLPKQDGRISIFLGTLSSTLIAVAFVGQISNLGIPFQALALVLLPTLLSSGQ